MTLRAAAVLPRITIGTPLRPLAHVMASHRGRKHYSGRMPVSANTVAIDARGSEVAAI